MFSTLRRRRRRRRGASCNLNSLCMNCFCRIVSVIGDLGSICETILDLASVLDNNPVSPTHLSLLTTSLSLDFNVL